MPKPDDDADPQIARAKAILASHHIQLDIQGCGCCGSPGVRMTYGGVPVIFSTDPKYDGLAISRDDVNFNMHTKKGDNT